MSKVQVKISTNSLNKALLNYNQMIEGMTHDALASLATEMTKEARKNIKKVKLDGPPVDIKVDFDEAGPRSYEVIASGRDALFAEYGTGVYSQESYPGNNPYGPGSYSTGGEPSKGLNQYWFYSLEADNQFGAGGAKAHYPREYKVKYLSPSGKPVSIDTIRDYYHNQKFLGNDLGKESEFVSQFRHKVPENPDKEMPINPNLGITHGNKPYAYMYNAFLKVAQKAPALAKKSYNWSHIYK